MAVALSIVALNVVIVHGVQTNQAPLVTALHVTWVFAVFLFTVRILRRLGALEKERPEPDDSMKLMFHCASMLPTTGYLPFFFVVLQ